MSRLFPLLRRAKKAGINASHLSPFLVSHITSASYSLRPTIFMPSHLLSKFIKSIACALIEFYLEIYLHSSLTFYYNRSSFHPLHAQERPEHDGGEGNS
jgi:hypothetical protein